MAIVAALIVSTLIMYISGLYTSMLLESVLAFVFTSINYAISIFALNKGFYDSDKKFLVYILGGMVGRLFLMLIFIMVSILYLKINQYSFIFVFFIFYLFYLIFEIYFTVKKDRKTYKY